MKILMTSDTVGGVWTYSLELCKSMKPYGLQFFVVTLGQKPTEDQKAEANAAGNIQLIETDYLLEWMQDPWRDIDESGQWLLRLEEVIRPDLVHLNCYSYGSLPFKAPVMVVAHSDVFSWFLSVKKEDPGPEWFNYFWRVKKGLEAASMVVAPSRTMLQYLENIYTRRMNSRVIYNARSFEAFYPSKKEPYIFSMGRVWDKAKNISLLANASVRIPHEIRIAGDQQFSGNFYGETLVGVNYLGRLTMKQVAGQLSKASVYVLPAKYEPFGLSALEAALSGCALVLGNIESLKEIWGDAALYVDTADPDALATTINSLMNSPAELAHYSKKALARAMRFAPEKMGDQYFQTYNQLVKAGHQQKELA